MPPKREKIQEDIFVTRSVILSFFSPPPGRSTFFDWVQSGKVVSAGSKRVLKGYYALNASLQRLGLPLVDIDQYRTQSTQMLSDTRGRQLLFTALAALSEEALLCPADELSAELMTGEMAKVVRHIENHQDALDLEGGSKELIADPLARIAYVGGVLDMYDLEKAGRIRGSGNPGIV